MTKKKKEDVKKEVKETMNKVSNKLKIVKESEAINEEIFLTIEEKFKFEFYLEKIKSSKLERESSEQKLVIQRLMLENFKLQMNAQLQKYNEDINELNKKVEILKAQEKRVKEEYVKNVSAPLRKKYGLGEHFAYDPITGKVMVTEGKPEEKK